MKKITIILSLLIGQAYAQVSAPVIEERCTQDNLSVPQASGRIAWAEKCSGKIKWRSPEATQLLGFFKTLARPKYPLLHNASKNNWSAPTSAATDCNSPVNIHFAWCTASCFTPEQKILFPEGEVEIGLATIKRLPKVVTLSNESNFDVIEVKATSVEAYQESINEAKEDIVEITTNQVKVLRVTTEHPILLANGQMVRARDLKKGQELLNIKGEKEVITSLEEKEYFGKVYNIAPKSDSINENIIVANGLLVGSANFQSNVDFQDYYYRQLSRSGYQVVSEDK